MILFESDAITLVVNYDKETYEKEKEKLTKKYTLLDQKVVSAFDKSKYYIPEYEFSINNFDFRVVDRSDNYKAEYPKSFGMIGISDKLKLPIINKDEIKEFLFDNLGIKDEEWAVKLGITSFELTYLLVEKLCQTDNTFIVEGNFENKYAARIFSDIKSKYDYRVLQIYCHAKVEVLYERYINRDNSGERHPGHIIQISGPEGFKSRVTNKNFKLDIDNSINIDIDTTRFEDIKLQQIYNEIVKNINL